MGILDTIIDTHQQQSLAQFELALIVQKILEPLKEREKNILIKRYGLQGNNVATLKVVGEEQGLTRERVRQIEKELLNSLAKSAQNEQSFATARDLILNSVLEHGGIMAEHRLLVFLNVSSLEETNAVKFLMNLMTELSVIEQEEVLKPAWANLTFNKDFLNTFISEILKLFTAHTKPFTEADFLKHFKETQFYIENQDALPDKVIINYLHTAGEIERNIFGEYGLGHWSDIKPRDVGDKAYLVMRHHKKPEHYSTITELINQHKLDKRTAYKETVHNKLIKDKRFVLVGRGIYALAEWGYQPGVVSDMIKEILAENKAPMSRDQIIEEVLKRRLVKKNTILVGLSNKKMFEKVGKNLYTLVS